LGAVALGGRVIEKHFTDDQKREGPDHPFSMTPQTWRAMVYATRELERALGDSQKHVAANEKETVVLQRRCVRAARALPAGTVLRRDDLDVLRPAPSDAVAPQDINRVLGGRLRVSLDAGQQVSWNALEVGRPLRIVTTIQARMLSSRLPGKVMMPILGKPNLELMIERLRRVKLSQDIIVATSTDPSCQVIEDLAKRLNVRCFRGSELDVLDRVLKAAHRFEADIVVETTGDCPLIDPGTMDRIIQTYLDSGVDYCSNTLKRTFPRGMDVQVFSVRVLDEVARLTKDPVDHEHVSIYIYEHPERFSLLNVESGLLTEEEAAGIRLTLDTPEDFELIRQVYERLYPKKPEFALDDVLTLIKKHPELVRINSAIHQKAVR
jgi:spore coat polysaccharide biosynthesis protein SpsF